MPSRIRRRLEGDEGVSLIEMMVAIVILGIAFLGLLSSTVSSLAASRAAHNEFDGSQRSHAVVEDLLRRPFDTSWVPASHSAVTNPTYPTVTRGSAAYTFATEVSWVDDPCNGSAAASPGIPDARMDYLRISVTTTWAAPDQTTRSQEIVLYRYPPHSWKIPARGAAC